MCAPGVHISHLARIPDGQSSFDENVKPNLPPDVVPTRTYSTLHSAFTA